MNAATEWADDVARAWAKLREDIRERLTFEALARDAELAMLALKRGCRR